MMLYINTLYILVKLYGCYVSSLPIATFDIQFLGSIFIIVSFS